MSRQSREIKALTRSLADVLNAALVADSYGVEGSDFVYCRICDSSSQPGFLYKPGWHKESCPVKRAENSHHKRLTVQFLGEIP